MTTITLRMDSDLKKNLQEIAKKLGVSLNQLINLKMREFDENRVLNLDLREDLEVEEFSKNEVENLEKYGNFSKLTNNLNSLLIEKGM